MKFLACLLLATSSLPAQVPSFSVSAHYIKVPVTVFDTEGKLLTDLQRENFTLHDEGQVRSIENFLSDQAPVNVLLMLDSSGSLREELEQIKLAALGFARAFTRKDRIAIIGFSDQIEIRQDWTNRLKPLRKTLKKLKRGYRTALYDALQQAIRHQFRGTRGRRVIILLTDGLDNESRSVYEELLPRLIASDITLYIVSRTRLVMPRVRETVRVQFLSQVMKNFLRDEGEDGDYVEVYFRQKEAAMKNLAESTGGRVLFPKRLEDLQPSYAQVAHELKHRYLLTFRPPLTSSLPFRRIEVACDRPIGQLHYRHQYAWRSAP